MTVAAVILAATPDSALAEADGVASARRIADVAWAGGAVPLVVVSHDPAGVVAQALAGTPVTLAEPAPVDGGPVAQIRRGIEVAIDAVTETQAALVWPARMTWVGAETVTSLIEAHGVSPSDVLVPEFDGERGWPALVPVRQLAALGSVGAERMPDQVLDDLAAGGIAIRPLSLGDPGTVHDRSVPRADLPPYVGPTEPAGGHVHEWGAAIADQPEDVPLEGPALAPYGQAVAADPDQPG